jgi:citrate synthase
MTSRTAGFVAHYVIMHEGDSSLSFHWALYTAPQLALTD